MTSHIPMARVPFAPLDNRRLQHLASAKNHQNGINNVPSKSSLLGKSILSSTPTAKRSFALFTADENNLNDENNENDVDSARTNLTSPAKKSKSDASACFTFSAPMSSSTSMPPPPSRLLRTPVRPSSTFTSSRTALTASAGRSPPSKRTSLLARNKSRRASAPFTRVDPPGSFLHRGTGFSSSSSSLPFSLDAALNGTFNPAPRPVSSTVSPFASSSSTSLSSSSSAPAAAKKPGTGATIQETMPAAWFFDIHEDAPGEEAANLMEHSTLTLDLSSDDEVEEKGGEGLRGKENCPPEGYEVGVIGAGAGDGGRGGSGRRGQTRREDGIVRVKVVVDGRMDEGGREALGDLDVACFTPADEDEQEGETGSDEAAAAATPDAASTPVVAATSPTAVAVSQEAEPEAAASTSNTEDVEPAASTDKETSQPLRSMKKAEAEIVIWDDAAAAQQAQRDHTSPSSSLGLHLEEGRE